MARSALAAWSGTEIELIMDQTAIDGRFHLLLVAVAFRKRAVPLLWCLLPTNGGSGAAAQKKLLAKVALLLPPETKIVLYADREYGSVELFTFLQERGWSFVIRMKRDVWLKMACGRKFQIQEVPLGRGQINFEDGVFLPEIAHPAFVSQLWVEQPEP